MKDKNKLKKKIFNISVNMLPIMSGGLLGLIIATFLGTLEPISIITVCILTLIDIATVWITKDNN